MVIYAVGTDHPLRAPSRAVIAAVERGVIDGRMTLPCLLEVLHVASRRRGPAAAATLLGITRRLVGPAVGTQEAVLDAAVDLFGEHRELGSVDAHLAAAAISLGAEVISADRDLDRIPGLLRQAPDDPALLARISGG